MNKRVSRVSLNQTAWTVALMTFFIGIVIAIISIIVGFIQGVGTGVLLYILLPFVIGICTYITYVVSYWFYNLAASITGGIEFDLQDK